MSVKSPGVTGGVVAGIGFTGYTDNSGAPGNTTINASRGRAAMASTATTCVVTNSVCKTTSGVFIQREATDTTAIQLGVAPANGSFTVTASAAAAATLVFDFVVFN